MNKFIKMSNGSPEDGREGNKSSKHSIWGSIFPNDLKVSNTIIFHPQDECLLAWNKFFVISCLFAAYVDPFLLYFPSMRESECLTIADALAVTITLLRTTVDGFYAIHIFFEFHTAYHKKVLGKSKLVTDRSYISTRYKGGSFLVDLLSVLPFPQIAIWACIYTEALVPKAMKLLLAIVYLQYIPRFLRVYPLIVDIQKTSGAFPNSSLAGAVYYLLWYLLVSNIFGASWYLLAADRNFACWNKACSDSHLCDETFLFCRYQPLQESPLLTKVMEPVFNNCSMSAETPPVTYGIYKEAVTHGLFTTRNFLSPCLYSFWWGLKNLSTLGQGLQTDIHAGEIIFTVSITLSGAGHCAFLVGNMHNYLKSFTTRLEELRIKKREMDQWMHRRLIPKDLRHRVGRYNQYRWWETGGMDEETLLQNLPKDIRRDVKRHLCMDMIRKVPIFGQMDDQFLDAFCENLKSNLYTEGAYIVHEGDPVNELVFITHGLLESVTTDGGGSKFINQSILKEGDYCGEELLPWALDPQIGSILPSSTRMVHALTEVEAFIMTPEDLKFLARQFRCLHTQQAKHLFRFYSQHWRTWASHCIQGAWRRYSERKRILNRQREACDSSGNSPSLTSTLYAFRFVHALRGVRLEKPPEPDFTTDTD